MPSSTDFSTASARWYTNFYYEEELRSVLMNGVLNSGFKPGIYNPKIALFTDSSGLHLYIGKGTTFIFSNNTYYDGSRYHQDLSSPGSYMIKSTAVQDITLDLISLGDQTVTSRANFILGDSNESYPVDKFYIVAYLPYDEEVNLGINDPVITIAYDNVDNVSYGSRRNYYNSELISETDPSNPVAEYDLNNYYYAYLDPTGNSYWIPDGSTVYGRNNSSFDPQTVLKETSYLIIGEVVSFDELDIRPGNAQTMRQYLDGVNWRTNVDGNPGAETWIKKHAFIGRGFPAYRQNLISNKNSYSPELIPSYYLNKIYLDVNDIYDGDILYESTLTGNRWGFEGPLGIGVEGSNYVNENKRDDTGERDQYIKPNRLKAFRLDYKCSPNNGDIYNDNPSSILEDLNNKIKSNPELKDSKYILISDIFFLTTRHKYSNLKDISIENIFGSEDELDSKLRVVPFRWFSTLNSSDLNSKLFNPSVTNDEETTEMLRLDGDTSAVESSIINNIPGYNQTASGSNYVKMLPLDVDENNLERLYKIIKNKNIIPIVLDYIRQHPGESPYLGPEEATSLIPAAIIFRKVRVEKEGDNITELIPVDYISSISDGTNPGRFHPCNVLSFFDIEYKTNKLNAINFKTDGIYSVLPVID